MTPHCTYCGCEIERGVEHYRNVTGWERQLGYGAASRRGGFDITLRRKGAELCCKFCHEKLKRGVATAQGTML